MIVGFTIVSITTDEQRQVLADYLKKICPITDDVIYNIANIGNGINVYSRLVTQEDLDNLPFETKVISTTPGRLMIISLLSQRLEIPIGEKVYSLIPTGYVEIENSEATGLQWAVNKGLIFITPGEDGSVNWDDELFWDDTKIWKEE